MAFFSTAWGRTHSFTAQPPTLRRLALITRGTAKFTDWLADLKDLKARAKVIIRMRHAAQGNFGDVKPISDGVSEMRIHFGPGYRIDYAREGRAVYLLLIGGDKSTQKRDIKTAISMWKQIQEEQP